MDEIKEERQWKDFRINFHGEAAEFPNNKFYATINIEPETARLLISKFLLIVKNCCRAEFPSSYQCISAAGFDVTNENNQIKVRVEAIPSNDNWKSTKKQSELCSFLFIGKTLTLNPIIHFNCTEDPSIFNVNIKWYHIGDDYAHKYVIHLDGKEIQYIKQSSIAEEMQVCIHDFKHDEEHTLQIIAKLKSILVRKEDTKNDVSVPERNLFKERALELLQLLEAAIRARLSD
ncbi:unnamed protein product [Rotaria sp. Silwood2]|nr:unnamed protein product [Rotaria sp. Silwood2]